MKLVSKQFSSLHILPSGWLAKFCCSFIKFLIWTPISAAGQPRTHDLQLLRQLISPLRQRNNINCSSENLKTGSYLGILSQILACGKGVHFDHVAREEAHARLHRVVTRAAARHDIKVIAVRRLALLPTRRQFVVHLLEADDQHATMLSGENLHRKWSFWRTNTRERGTYMKTVMWAINILFLFLDDRCCSVTMQLHRNQALLPDIDNNLTSPAQAIVAIPASNFRRIALNAWENYNECL